MVTDRMVKHIQIVGMKSEGFEGLIWSSGCQSELFVYLLFTFEIGRMLPRQVNPIVGVLPGIRIWSVYQNDWSDIHGINTNQWFLRTRSKLSHFRYRPYFHYLQCLFCTIRWITLKYPCWSSVPDSHLARFQAVR